MNRKHFTVGRYISRMNHCDACARNKTEENSFISRQKASSKIDVDDTKKSESICKHQHDSHIKSLLAHIDKTPIKCPISQCSQLIGITSVMRHFLRDHRTRIPVNFLECYEGERVCFKFDESVLSHGETVCFGVLAYGGIEADASARPGLSGLSLVNFMLPENYSELINHMAITVLGCKLSLGNLFSGDTYSNRTASTYDDIVVIWLAAAETTKRVHCTVTAFNVSCSRSVIIEIQNLKFTNRKPILDAKNDFLILNRGDINILSNSQQNSIDLEVSIQEIKSVQCEGS